MAGLKLPAGFSGIHPGPDDVTGMKHRGWKTAQASLAEQEALDRRLLHAVLAEGIARLLLRRGHHRGVAMHPDRPAGEEVLHPAPQRLDDVRGAGQREADEVDHHVGLQGRDLPAEAPRLLLPVPVHRHALDRAPGAGETVRLALSPGHDHDLVALLDEARNKVCPDVPRCPDDDDLHGVPPFPGTSIHGLTDLWQVPGSPHAQGAPGRTWRLHRLDSPGPAERPRAADHRPVQFPDWHAPHQPDRCLLIGVLSQLAESRGVFSSAVRTLVFIGILGGYTTVSTFSNEPSTSFETARPPWLS